MHQNWCTQTSMVTLPQGSIIILKMTLTLKQKLWNIQSKTLQSHNSQQWWSTVLVYEQYPWPIYQPIVNLRQREGKKRGFMQSGSILPASAAPSILMSSTSSDQVPLLTHLKTDLERLSREVSPALWCSTQPGTARCSGPCEQTQIHGEADFSCTSTTTASSHIQNEADAIRSFCEAVCWSSGPHWRGRLFVCFRFQM